MPIANKTKGAVLNSTLTTTLHTAGASDVSQRFTHILISNGSNAGTVTLSVYDSSASTTYELLNAVPISANTRPIELFDIFLEANDEIRGGAVSTTGAKVVFCYQVET